MVGGREKLNAAFLSAKGGAEDPRLGLAALIGSSYRGVHGGTWSPSLTVPRCWCQCWGSCRSGDSPNSSTGSS